MTITSPNATAIAAWLSYTAEAARTFRRHPRPEPALIALAH